MTYSTSNPPKKIGYSYALATYGPQLPSFFAGYAPVSQMWEYTTNDSPSQILGTNYFSNGSTLGMAVNDVVFCRTIPQDVYNAMAVSQVIAGGGGSVLNALDFAWSFAWASRPSFMTVPLGTKILITDLGNTGGSVWQSTLSGWSPLSGVLTLANNWGSAAAPVASLNAASGLFVPAGGSGSLIIPGGVLLSGRAKLELEMEFNRLGANATGVINIFFGSSLSISDSNVYSVTTTATNNRATRPCISMGFTPFVVTTTSYNAPGGSADGAAVDRNTNIDISTSMGFTFALASANAADTFNLIGYSLKLVQ